MKKNKKDSYSRNCTQFKIRRAEFQPRHHHVLFGGLGGHELSVDYDFLGNKCV